MELVYLWVEEYKNIKRQGFNFSGRFKCEYNPEYEKKECCKDRIEKESIKKDSHPIFTKNLNYQEIRILPKNVNVTAIIGENGSGKTAILRELLNTGDIGNIKRTKLYVYNKKTNKVEYIDFETLDKKETQVILFDEDIDSLSHTNAYSIDYLIDIKDRYKKNNVVIALLGFDKDLYNIGNLPYIPTHIEIGLNNKIDLNASELIGLSFEYDDDWNDTTGHISISINDINYLKQFLQKELSQAIKNCTSLHNSKDYLYIKEFIYKLNHRDKLAIYILRKLVLNSFNDANFIKTLNEDLYNESREDNFKLIIKRINKFIKINGFDNQKITIGLTNPNVEQILKNANRDFFDIDFLRATMDKNLYFKDLSSGEQKLVLLFGKLNYVVRKFNMEKENYILLLDEPDIYLHPNWQKKLISYFINFIENNQYLNEKNIHIIIASHSPFILSDLPKENVIFLKDGKQVYPDIDTFGANIHTLLSHGFFMKDGLMGEFAEEKINKAIKYLNKKTLSQKEIDYCEDIISIIGEPILKRQLQKMFDSKRLTEIEQIKEEIKRLEDRMTSIWKNSK